MTRVDRMFERVIKTQDPVMICDGPSCKKERTLYGTFTAKSLKWMRVEGAEVADADFCSWPCLADYAARQTGK